MDKSKMDKLFAKKKGKEMSENEKDAKMSVVHALREFAAGEMGKKVSGLKQPKSEEKSPSSSMADLLGKSEEESEEMSDEESEDVGPEGESDEMSEEELDAKIQELMAKKAELKS